MRARSRQQRGGAAGGRALPITAVWGVSPIHGPPSGGTPVTVHGLGFTGATAVKFDGNDATSVVVVDDNTITCDTPAGVAGLVMVEVDSPSGDGEALAYSYDQDLAVFLNRVPFLSKAVDYAIAQNIDFHVTVTVTGKQITLPAAPSNGESYEVHSLGPTVQTTIHGNGHNIDDGQGTVAADYVQSFGETSTLRFNGTSGHWEVS